jgi:hypothetical protein
VTFARRGRAFVDLSRKRMPEGGKDAWEDKMDMVVADGCWWSSGYA